MPDRTAYCISADAGDMGEFDESCLYDIVDSINAGRIENKYHESNTAAILELERRLSAAGFPLETFATKSTCAFMIKAMDKDALLNAQMRFLNNSLQSLKHMVGCMRPCEFAEKATVCRLKTLIEDPFGDVVWLDMGTGAKAYFMPEAIRSLIPDTCYYVDARTVALH